MNQTVEYLKQVGVYYLATVEDGQPRVRPFGAATEMEGRVYFCTRSTKKVCRQMKADSRVEICGMGKDGGWIRVSGRAVFDERESAKAEMLEKNPFLVTRFHYQANDETFALFYLEDMESTHYSFTQEPTKL